MKVRWILTREAAGDLVVVLGRRVRLAELHPRHALRAPDGAERPVWRLGRALHRAHMIVMERREERAGEAVLVREIVQVTPPHERWRGPSMVGQRPTPEHRALAHAAQRAGVFLGPADVRDMGTAERLAFAERLATKGARVPAWCLFRRDGSQTQAFRAAVERDLADPDTRPKHRRWILRHGGPLETP